MRELGGAPVEIAAPFLAMRRKSEEGEGEWGDAAGDEGEDAGERSGHRLDRESALACDAHDAIAGIGDERHAGIAHHGDRLAARDALREPCRLLVFGVLVETLGRDVDTEMREELARVARVFAKD